jgi:hypothetical protein
MQRRKFLGNALMAFSGSLLELSDAFGQVPKGSNRPNAQASYKNEELYFQSSSMDVRLCPQQPAVESLNIDSLGLGKLGASVLLPPYRTNAEYSINVQNAGDGTKQIDYRRVGSSSDAPPEWSV